VQTYRRAAELIRTLPADITTLIRSGRARELRGIGASVEAKLRELVTTGRIEELRRLQEEVRPELAALGQLLGLKAKRMLAICKALGIGW
jgi:DNA polymerase (family X)